MTNTTKSPDKRLWQWMVNVGSVEAISFLILLLIAVPFKYIGNNPVPVKIMGPIHGVLFLAYVALVFMVSKKYSWKVSWTTLALMASVVPGGPFVFDAWIKHQPDAIEK